jgi:hypothetical protein
VTSDGERAPERAMMAETVEVLREDGPVGRASCGHDLLV